MCADILFYSYLCTQTTYNGSGCSGSCCSGGFYTQAHLNLPTVSGTGALFFLFYRRGQVTCPKPHSHQRQRQDEPSAVCSEPAGNAVPYVRWLLQNSLCFAAEINLNTSH